MLGALTFTMTALPGTPAIQNAIPMPFFNTDLYAAPGLGVLSSIFIIITGMWWLNKRIAKADSKEGYGNHVEIHSNDGALTTSGPSLTIAFCSHFSSNNY